MLEDVRGYVFEGIYMLECIIREYVGVRGYVGARGC